MKILLTNDDGYKAKGLHALAEILRPYGELTVVAPKYHQSGMSMAVNLGFKPIAVKQISEKAGERWYYIDATPSSCVKFGLDNVFIDDRPDIVVSGINHGLNAGMCAPYSGTIGAASEAALARVPSIAVSLDDFSREADFSAISELFPKIFERLCRSLERRFGLLYNVNFPNLPSSEIKGVRVARLGRMHWEKEFRTFDPGIYERLGLRPLEDLGVTWRPAPEEGEDVYTIVGDMITDEDSPLESDHLLLEEGYIVITPQNLDNTDLVEMARLKALGFEAVL